MLFADDVVLSALSDGGLELALEQSSKFDTMVHNWKSWEFPLQVMDKLLPQMSWELGEGSGRLTDELR